MARRDFLSKAGLATAALGLRGLPLGSVLTSWTAAANADALGKTLVVGLATEPAGLVQGITVSGTTEAISPNIFDGLVEVSDTGELVPALAESWRLSDDGRSITFQLRKNAFWHDGKPVTAADIQYSIMEVAKKTHPRARSVLAAVVAVETPDSKTAVFRLSNPSPVIWKALYGTETQILPRHIYADKPGTVYDNPNNQHPVGSGPFVFKEWVKGSHVALERNPNYWDRDKPYLDRVIFKFIPDANSREAALETNEIQYATLSPVPLHDVKRYQNSPAYTVDFSGYDAWATMYFFDFNLRKPIFKDLRVRQAIAHAINRDALSNTAWAGLAKPATGPIPSYQRDNYTADTVQYPFDPALAERLLDEAGHPRKAGGVRFSIDHIPDPYGEPEQRSAVFFKQALKRVGIELTIRSFDLATYLRKAFAEYDFDTHSAWYASFLDPQIGVTRRYWTKSISPGTPASNASGFSDPEMDSVIDSILHEGDEKRRHQAVVQLQRLAQSKLPSINLLEIPVYRIYRKTVQGVSLGPTGAARSFRTVRIESAPSGKNDVRAGGAG